jgi:hypothetical protein
MFVCFLASGDVTHRQLLLPSRYSNASAAELITLGMVKMQKIGKSAAKYLSILIPFVLQMGKILGGMQFND